MRLIKKFESFNDVTYEPSDYEWFLSHKRVGITDDEYFKICNFINKNMSIRRILPINPPAYYQNIFNAGSSKHSYDPSNFCEIHVEVTNFIHLYISKIDDDWWFVRTTNDINGLSDHYKCDGISGLFDFIKSS